MTSDIEYQEEMRTKPPRTPDTQDGLAAIQPLHITLSPEEPWDEGFPAPLNHSTQTKSTRMHCRQLKDQPAC